MGEKEPGLWGKVRIIEDTDGEVGHLLLACDGIHTPSGSRKRADRTLLTEICYEEEQRSEAGDGLMIMGGEERTF